MLIGRRVEGEGAHVAIKYQRILLVYPSSYVNILTTGTIGLIREKPCWDFQYAYREKGGGGGGTCGYQISKDSLSVSLLLCKYTHYRYYRVNKRETMLGFPICL